MRNILFLLMLSAAFLGGYYLRGKPNSPDIFAEANKIYHRLTTVTDHAVKTIKQRTNISSPSDLDKKSNDMVDDSPRPLSANTAVHYRSEPIRRPDSPSLRW